MDESEIIEQAFPLIFAFDEIVALGYRESVNLAQIRTFTEMDSHEEKVYQAVRQVRIWKRGGKERDIGEGGVGMYQRGGTTDMGGWTWGVYRVGYCEYLY